MATHSSILAWKIPCTEEPGRLQFMESQETYQPIFQILTHRKYAIRVGCLSTSFDGMRALSVKE